MTKMPHCKCLRCNYSWIPRTEKKPRWCPRCNSPYYDRPRVRFFKSKSVPDKDVTK